MNSSIPRSWIKIISDNKTSDICHLSPHLNSGERFICIKKLTSMEFYKLLIKNQCKPPTSITSYENRFQQRFD